MPLPDTFTAQTAEQARLLHDRAYSRLLGQLVQAELSAAQLAKLVHQDVKSTHHRLMRLQNAGLIEVCAEQQRSGRPIKIYRAVAQTFDVPFHLTSAATFADFMADLHRDHLQKHFEVTGELVMRHTPGTFSYLPTGNGTLIGTIREPFPTEKDVQDVALSTYYRHRLTPEQAREAEKRLAELTAWLEEQSEQNGQSGESYTLGLFFSPETLE